MVDPTRQLSITEPDATSVTLVRALVWRVSFVSASASNAIATAASNTSAEPAKVAIP
jgi:hypothetical protein